MSRRIDLLRDAFIGLMLVCISFGCGWLVHGYKHGTSRRVSFDFSSAYRIPNTHQSIGLSPTASTRRYRVGDRIDILVRQEGKLEPLLLDVIVSDVSQGNFGIIVPSGGWQLISFARENGLVLEYRRSVATAMPVALESL